jgi:hypothetical protein
MTKPVTIKDHDQLEREGLIAYDPQRELWVPRIGGSFVRDLKTGRLSLTEAPSAPARKPGAPEPAPAPVDAAPAAAATTEPKPPKAR